MFKPLVLLALTTVAMTSWSQELQFVRNASQLFELLNGKSGAEQIIIIDKALRREFQNDFLLIPGLAMNDFIEIRRRECAANTDLCISSARSWIEKSCEHSNVEFQTRLWNSIFGSVKSDPQALAALKLVQDCGKSSLGQITLGFGYTRQLAQSDKFPQAYKAAMTWNEKLSREHDAKKWFDLVLDYNSSIRQKAPFPAMFAGELARLTIHWAQNPASKLTQETKARWFSATRELLHWSGDFATLATLIDSESAFIPKLAEDARETAIFSYCVAQRYLGRYPACQKMVDRFKAISPVSMTLQEATQFMEMGRYDESIALVKKVWADNPTAIPAKVWGALTIAQDEAYKKNFKSAIENVEFHVKSKATDTRADDLERVHGQVVSIRVAWLAGQFERVWPLIDAQRVRLAKYFRGKSYESINVEYQGMVAALAAKDRPRAEKYLAEIKPWAVDRKAGDFYRLAVAYVEKRMAKRSGEVELAQMKKLRTSGGIDFRDLELSLAGW